VGSRLDEWVTRDWEVIGHRLLLLTAVLVYKLSSKIARKSPSSIQLRRAKGFPRWQDELRAIVSGEATAKKTTTRSNSSQKSADRNARHLGSGGATERPHPETQRSADFYELRRGSYASPAGQAKRKLLDATNTRAGSIGPSSESGPPRGRHTWTKLWSRTFSVSALLRPCLEAFVYFQLCGCTSGFAAWPRRLGISVSFRSYARLSTKERCFRTSGTNRSGGAHTLCSKV
jgi:hypothetical protein